MRPREAEPRITLFGPAVTPYTVKVVRALRLKRLSFTLREPRDLEDFRRWSPRTGLLPVLDLDGERVADSVAILDLLDERFPEPPLTGADPKLAREQRSLETWVGEAFPFYHFRSLRARLGAAGTGEGAPGALGPMARLGLIGSDGRIRPEFFDTSDGGPGAEFTRRLDDLAKLLGERPYFFGDRISRADLAVFGFLDGLVTDRHRGGSALVRARPNLWEHTERVDRATGGAAPG
jgi:glutathione S-transferase